MNDNEQASQVKPVNCPSKSEPYVRLYIIAGLLIALGIWCFLDRGEYGPPTAWDFPHLNEVAGYLLNHYGLYVLGPLGVLCIYWARKVRNRLLVADDEGIGYIGKDKVAWSDVVRLDASLLQEKQLLRLVLTSGKKMSLDGWKLVNFRELVALVEKKAPSVAEGGEEA